MLTEKQKKIVEDNHNLIYGFCRTYKLEVETVYDLLSIALCRCAEKYNSNAGYAFSTYVFQSFRRILDREDEHKTRQKRIPENQIDKSVTAHS